MNVQGVFAAYVIFPWSEWAVWVLPIVAAIILHAFIIRPRKK
jgi:hypothetical protein